MAFAVHKHINENPHHNHALYRDLEAQASWVTLEDTSHVASPPLLPPVDLTRPGGDNDTAPSVLSTQRDNTVPAVRVDHMAALDVVGRFVDAFKGSPPIQVVRTFAELPAAIQKDARDQGSNENDTKAVFDHRTGSVYVVSGNHSSTDAVEESIFHEVLGHAGMRALLGKEFIQEMNKLFISLGGLNGLAKIAKARGFDKNFAGYVKGIAEARQKNPKVWTTLIAKAVLAEEVFAHTAQTNPKLFDRLKALVGRFRAALRRLGLPGLASMGETDLLWMLQKARVLMNDPSTEVPGEGNTVLMTAYHGSTAKESRGNFAYTEGDDLLDTTTPNRTLDGAELAELRRAAARLEHPQTGTFLYVSDDGRAIATGEKGTRIPETFIRFAKQNGLKFEARRIVPQYRYQPLSSMNIGITKKSEPMPIEYREDGAMYFGETGASADRTGKTRFSRRIRGERPSVNDFIVPETPEFDGDMSGDLGRIPDAAARQGVEALPIRLAVGVATGAHSGFGVNHIADNGERFEARDVPKYTNDPAENIARHVALLARSFNQVFADAGRVIVRSERMGEALVLEKRADRETGDDYYSATTIRPAAKNVWGNPVWVGRLTFPTNESRQPGASTLSDGQASSQPSRIGQRNQTERFDLTPTPEKKQAASVSYRRRRAFTARESREGIATITDASPAEIRRAFVKAFGESVVRDQERAGLVNIVPDVSAFNVMYPNVRVATNARALFHDGKAFFIADRMTPATAAIDALHEIGEHYGLERMLGETGYRALIDRVKSMRNAGDEYVTRAWNFVVREYIEKEADQLSKLIEGSDHFMHEVLAQIGQNANIKKQGWWKQMLATVKRWLVKEFGYASNIDVNDIQDMVLHSLKMAANGSQSGLGGKFSPSYGMASNQGAWYYSALSTAIPAMSKIADKSGKVTGTAAKAWLIARQKEGKFKQDELVWSGLTDWLDTQTGKVAVADIERFVRENGVQVEEVVLGGQDAKDDAIEKLEAAGYIVEDDGLVSRENDTGDIEEVNGWDLPTRELMDAAAILVGASEGYAGSPGVAAPKFSDYRPPGGENYRELLLTLPSANAGRFVAKQDGGKWSVWDSKTGEFRNDVSAYASKEDADFAAKSLSASGQFTDRPDFRSQHWDQPNVLAHMRVDTVQGADGKRYLRVVEIQSDWAQIGKKEGFAIGSAADRRVAFDEAQAKAQEAKDRVTAEAKRIISSMGFDSYSDMLKHDVDLRKQYRAIQAEDAAYLQADAEAIRLDKIAKEEALKLAESERALPSAPFVTDTKSWTALVIKRALMMAVQEGHDGIVFATGEQSAGLYPQLVQFVDSITATAQNASGDRNVTLNMKDGGPQRLMVDGNGIVRTGKYDGKGLDSVIGKEISSRILDNREAHTIKEDGLKVGDAGMRTYYDTIVPSVTKDVLKKLGAGDTALGNVGIDTGEVTSNPWKAYDVTDNGDGELVAEFETEQAAIEWAEGPYGGGVKIVKEAGGVEQQPGFLIPDTLRAKALGGLPLFSKSATDWLVHGFKLLSGIDGAHDTRAVDSSITDIDEIAKVIGAESFTNIKIGAPVKRDDGSIQRSITIDKKSGKFVQDGKQVHLDVGSFGEGGGGSLAYAVIGAYTHNNGLTFRADQSGMYPAGIVRRTENMIALALKYGTTDFMLPSFQWQTKKGALGMKQWPGFDWVQGDTKTNLKNMIDASNLWVEANYPEIKNVIYDVSVNDFRSRSTGELVSEDQWKDAAESDGARKAYAGVRTLKRVAFANTLRSSEDGRRLIDGLLAAKRRPANTNIRGVLYSRGSFLDEAQATETYQRLKSSLSRGPTEHTFNKWWHTTVGTMAHLASINQPFAKVFNSVQSFLDDAAAFSKRAEEKAPGLIPTGFFAKPLDPYDAAAIADPIFKSTLHKHVLTDDEMRAGRFLISDPEEISMPQEWVAIGKLNERQIDYVHQFYAAINHSLEDATRADLLRMARRALPKEMTDIAFAETQTAAEFADRMEEAAADRSAITGEDNLLAEWRDSSNALLAKLEKLRSEGYAPLMRFGEYTLYFYQKDESGAKKPIYFTMFDSESERNATEAELRAQVEEEFGEVEVERNIRKEMASPMFEGMTPEMVESFAKALGVEQDAVYQEFLKKATNNRSTLRRLIHRKGTAGYSNDITRVLASFVVSNARRSSAAIHMTEARENLEDIERGDVFNVAKDLVNYVQNPTEEAGALRGFMFFNFLGGSLASAMVNYTQVALQVTPYLYQFAKTGAAKEVAKALSLATQVIYADLRHQPMPDMSRELTAALERANQEGITQPNEIHQLMAEARGGTWSRAGGRKVAKLLGKNEAAWGAKAEWTMQRLMRGWGSFFGIAEQSNRLTAFIAAHSIATQQGMGEQAAYEFAKKAVTETASIYNKGNRPAWARGAIGASLFTFKQFSIQYLEFMRRLYTNDKEAFAVGVGMLILMAGVTGLPGSDDLDDILDTLGQWMGYPTNTKRWRRKHVESVFGKAGSDFVLNGVSAILPVDVHARLGLGNIIPGTGMLNPARQDKEKEALEVIGPFGGLVLNYLNATKIAARGDILKAAEAAAPSAIANLSKGIRMAATGYAEDRQGKRVADVTKFEAFMKGIGIQPDAISDVYKLRGEMETDKAIIRNMKSALSDQWADGIAHQDAKATQEAMKKLREWNMRYPDYKITIRRGDVARKAHEMKSSAKERYLKYSPKDLRERFTEDLAN